MVSQIPGGRQPVPGLPASAVPPHPHRPADSLTWLPEGLLKPKLHHDSCLPFLPGAPEATQAHPLTTLVASPVSPHPSPPQPSHTGFSQVLPQAQPTPMPQPLQKAPSAPSPTPYCSPSFPVLSSSRIST